MDYDKQVDGNMAALNAYENKVEANERAFEHMIESILADEILSEYEELRARFNRFTENYGFKDYTFNEFIGENL